MKELQRRLQAPTPPFFKKLRNAGLLLTAVGTAILTAPVSLPAVLTGIAGYLAVAGGIASAISQAAVKEEP